MSFTELLRKYLPEGRSNKSVAMDWLAQRQAAGHQYSSSYVETRFSRCLSGDAAAVRFFFGARDSAVMLMDVLGVPPDARDELLAAADRHLADGPQHPPPRMVIDLTRWATTTQAKALFESLRTQVIERALVKPAVLIVSPQLHEDLPRSFDKVDWLRVVVVEPDQGDDPVKELLADGALLVSPTMVTDPEYWLAIDFDPTHGLVLEPADGLAAFAHHGKMSLPSVEHDLAAVVADLPAAPTPPTAKLGPIETRMTMTHLRLESHAGSVSMDPAIRFALANALGIVGTSTPRDRVEADLRAANAGLGVAAPAGFKQADLDALLARARRRPVAATVMRVDDEIHYLNPPDGQAGLDHPRVRVHRIAAPEPEIARLRSAIADWTIGDFEADPFLVGVIARLDPEHRDHLAFLHARAWLLALGVQPAPGQPIDDWRAALAHLLAGDVPPAMLMLDSSPAIHAAAYVATGIPSWVSASIDGVDDETAVRLHHVPSPLDAVPVARSSRVYRAVEERYDHYGNNRESRLALPEPTKEGATTPALDDDWLDAFDAFVAKRGRVTPRVRQVRMNETKDLPWESADRVLSATWLALTMAIEGNGAVRSREGTVTMHLGGGLAAVIDVTSTAADHGGPRATLDMVFGENYSRSDQYRLERPTSAGVDNVQFVVPIRVVVMSGRVRAEITFTASPLLLGGSGGAVALQGARSAVQAAAEAAARRRADDDD